MASEVTIELKLLPEQWELSSVGPYVLPLTATVEDLREIVNSTLTKGDSRSDWSFRLRGIRIDKDILGATTQLAAFSTETTSIVEVYIPLKLDLEGTGETPDALVKIMSDRSNDDHLICLGSRANITILKKSDLSSPGQIIHSPEPNSVDLLETVEKDSYSLITSCGIIGQANITSMTIEMEGKVDSPHRITAAALTGDIVILGDADGSVRFFSIPTTKKRSANEMESQNALFKWSSPSPLFERARIFGNSVTSIDVIEDKEARIYAAVICSLDGFVKVVDTIDGTTLNTFNAGKPITAYKRTAQYILTGHVDGRCKIWSYEDLGVKDKGYLKNVCVCQPHSRSITGIDLLENMSGRDVIVSVSNDRRLCCTDVNTKVTEVAFAFYPEHGDDQSSNSELANLGPVSDYGIYPTALLLEGATCFIGTNNQRVHQVHLQI